MYVGADIGGVWNKAREEALFYEGYGRTEIDLLALAYYRHERDESFHLGQKAVPDEVPEVAR